MSASGIRYDPGPLVLVGLGCVLTAIHFAHILSVGGSLTAFVTGSLLPLALSLVVVYQGYRLRQSSLGPRESLRVAGCAVITAVGIVTGAGLLIVYQTTHGVRMDEPLYILMGAVSFGTPPGVLIGTNNSRLRKKRARVAETLDAVTVFNRVLRHDLRNKMSVVRGRTNLLAQAAVDDANAAAEHRAKIHEVVEEIIDISEQSGDLEAVVRDDSDARQAVDLAAAVERAAADIRDRHAHVQVDGLTVETCSVLAHPKLEVALLELLDNAVVHGGTRTPEVTVRRAPTGDRVELRIVDDGPGIPETVVDTLERGYETSLDHNLGLGLWLALWIVETSNGSVAFSRTANGTAVTLSFEYAGDDANKLSEFLPSSPQGPSTVPSSADD